MRRYDRDYHVGTIAALQEQRRLMMGILNEMDKRLDELEESLIVAADQEEDVFVDNLIDECFETATEEILRVEESFKTTPKKNAQCLCDKCWEAGDYNRNASEHGMD